MESQSAHAEAWSWKRESRTRLIGREIWYYGRLLLVALACAFVIKESVVEAYRIPSESMENTLLVGDFLLANKFIYGARIPFTDWHLPAVRQPRVGDVVVFRFPEDQRKSFVKRVVAVGGDTVELINKKVYVNGTKRNDEAFAIHFDQTIIPRGVGKQRDNFGPLVVPEGQYFVLGDNRDNSADSRYWGCVPRNLMVGKAQLIHWSWIPDENSPELSLSKPLSFFSYIGYHIRHLPDRVRWNRIFKSVS